MVGRLFRKDQDHAHTQVEGVEHIVVIHSAQVLEVGEDGVDLDGLPPDQGPQAVREGTGDVLIEAPTGDVGDRPDGHFLKDVQDFLDVDFGGLQEDLAHGLSGQVEVQEGPAQIARALGQDVIHREGVIQGDLPVGQDLPDQGEAVGMEAGGGEGQEDVPFLDVFGVGDLGLFHDAYGKAGDVVFVFGVEAGHFSGFSADEAGAGLDAALGHALDDGGDPVGVVLPAGDVVQEEEGLGPQADDVIDAHGHGIDSDGVVGVHVEGQLELGPDPVGPGDQDGLFIALGELEEAAEAPDGGEDPGAVGPGQVVFHELNGPVAGGDIDAGLGIGGGVGLVFIGGHAYSFPFQQ